MEAVVALAFFAPLILLVWALVRHASRIRREAIDKDIRTQHLDALNPALVRFVLERDQHACQRCGAKTDVGVDFIDSTPEENQEITPRDLEATCSTCFLARWGTLHDRPGDRNYHSGIFPRLW